MPGTYHKMEDNEGGRRHKHRHHSHHKHRHSGHSDSGKHHGAGHQPSTDTSLETASNIRHGTQYEDSLYNPKDSLYSPGVKDSLYSGDDGAGNHHQTRGYHSGSDNRLTSPGRFSPRHSDRERLGERHSDRDRQGERHSDRERHTERHSDRERHGENTFDHVTRSSQHQSQRQGRSQEERIWQDAVSRGAESGQIRSPTDIQNIYLPTSPDQPKLRKPDPTNFRGYIEPGRPGSGLAAAAALVRGDNYTPEKITTGGKVKVPPPVPQKPGKSAHAQYDKMGMDDLWPGGWEEYSK